MVNVADKLAVDLRDVTKIYRRRVHALRGIEMRVHSGEIFGLLGPNGAGKTTLVKIMMTVVRPNRAKGTVLGRPMGNKTALARIGYLPEHARFPGYLTGRQALEFYAALAKVGRRARKERAGQLLETVGLSEAADLKLATYSKGMAQRLGIAQAIINDPDLVVLDEPTDGVDPVGRREIRQILVNLRAMGTTVFVNSHLLGELEMVCDRVAILVAGLVVRQGTMDELTKDRCYYEIDVDAPSGGKVTAAIRAALGVKLKAAKKGGAALRGTLPSGQTVELTGGQLHVDGIDAAPIQPILDALRGADLIVRAVRPIRQSLEELFIETVTADVADAPPPWPGQAAAPPPWPGAPGPQGGAQ